MAIGLTQYALGRRRLTGTVREAPNPLPPRRRPIVAVTAVAAAALAGAFAALWTRLGSRQPSTPAKFAAGTALMGLAFLLFLPLSGGGPNSAPLLGLSGILVFTVAELLLSPVGLSRSTKVAPAAFRTQMVALFFLSIAPGTAASGTVAGYYSEDREVAYFGILGTVAIGLGILLAAIGGPVRRLMSGTR